MDFTEYADRHAELVDRCRRVRAELEGMLTDGGVNFHEIVGRVKSEESIRAKLLRNGDDDIKGIHDLIGVRVIANLITDVPVIAELLTDALDVLEVRDKTREVRDRGQIGYGSLHLIARLQASDEFVFEVQIRTILQDAWAQFEHDVRYKPKSGTVTPEIDRSLTLASGLLELADEQFARIQIMQIAQSRAENRTREIEDARPLEDDDIRDALLEILPDQSTARKSHYGWGRALLRAIGVTTIGDLRRVLDEADFDALRAAMQYRYRPGPIRLLDDELLDRFGEDYLEATEGIGDDPGRAGKLRHRLALLRKARRNRSENPPEPGGDAAGMG